MELQSKIVLICVIGIFSFTHKLALGIYKNKTDRNNLTERIEQHVLYLSAYLKFSDSRKIVIPKFFFEDQCVKATIERFCDDGSVCLKDCWREYGEDILFLKRSCREFIFLLAVLYHNLSSIKSSYARKMPWLSLEVLYIRFMSVSYDQLLDLLDEYFSYYQATSLDFGNSAKSPSMCEVLVDYWWMPTILVTCMALIIFNYQRFFTLQPRLQRDYISVGREAININRNTCNVATYTEFSRDCYI